MTRINKKEPVTRGLLDEAVETLLGGMDNLFNRFKKELDQKFKKELEPIKADITFIKRDIQDIKADRFDTPTRKEFSELKGRVDKFSPVS